LHDQSNRIRQVYPAKWNPLNCQSLKNPWRRYFEESTVVPNVIQRRKPERGGEERILRSQLVLFGLWLRGLPEWLPSGRGERRKAIYSC
jgi:hypothetical protein